MSIETAAVSPSIRSIFTELRPYGRDLVRAFVAIVVCSIAAAMTPILVAVAINEGIIGGDVRWVLLGAGCYVVTATTQAVTMAYEIRATSRFTQGYLSALRVRLMRHIVRLPLDHFTEERTGTTVSRVTSDVENLQQFLDGGLGMVSRSALSLVISLGIVFSQSRLMCLLVVASMVPLVLASVWYRPRAFASQLEVRTSIAALLAALNESIFGMRVVHAFNLQDQHRQEFAAADANAVKARIGAARLSALYHPLVELLHPCALAAVLLYGAVLVQDGRLDIGRLVAITLYVGRVFDPIQQFTELSHQLQQARASFARIFAFLAGSSAAATGDAGGRPYQPGRGEIAVEHVRFHYGVDQPWALDDVSVFVPAGQRIALVGESGAGKSTLAKLIAGFYVPQQGRVLVDGQDVAELNPDTLRQHVSLVPQEGYLFDGTIADNICLARVRTDLAEAEEACRALGILSRVEALPEGLKTVVSNRGLSLSAGERQLVALARAFLADPTVVILDEATSSVDPATEAAVERSMRALLEGRTSVVIAHRVSSALRADRVVMLAGHKVVEDGEPAVLMGRDGPFRQWAVAGGYSKAG